MISIMDPSNFLKPPVRDIEGKAESRDRFLENPPRQPKREIADMLESQGILVPRRFEGLAEALDAIKQGKDVVVRSEHPSEYAGASGLLDSHLLTTKRIEEGKSFCDENGSVIDWDNFYQDPFEDKEGIEDRIFGSLDTSDQSTFEENLRKLSFPSVQYYCKLLGLNIDQFSREISFSYWERVRGFNRSIVADSAITNRYHIFTSDTSDKDEEFYHNYSILDNGEVVLDNPFPMTDEMKLGTPDVITFYEKIRNTKGFDPNHCPLVEFQTFEGQNYFLQYHRTRDAELSKWKLERGLEEGEFEAAFVRGITTPDGLVLSNVAMYYPPRGTYTLEEPEDGSFDFSADPIFSEIMSRRRVANFSNKALLNLAFITSVESHLPKSKMFNPQIFVSIDGDMGEIQDRLFGETLELQKPIKCKVRVVSDGRKAYVKFLS